MKVIVGLGNPGPRYRRTRHNVGFEVLDCLAARLNTAFTREKHRGLLAAAAPQDQKLWLVKPLTFMNASGECVARIARNTVPSLADLLVVDDVHLPVGRLRLRPNGSAGGHNGLKSIIERLGTTEFPRLRLGIGRDPAQGSLTRYVLAKFTPEEDPVVAEMVEQAADAVECWLVDGIDRAMNELN